MPEKRFALFTLTMESITKNMQRYKNRKMYPFGLSSAHVLCLFSLRWAKAGMTASELSEACALDKSFVSRVTAKLIDLGYLVYLDPAAPRKYRAKLALTKEGKEVIAFITRTVNATMKQVSGDISPEDLHTFYRVLQHIDTNLSNMIKETSDESETDTAHP
ncbi:MAG: MarR family transcriptional regulator [Eubacteriales bacterium]